VRFSNFQNEARGLPRVSGGQPSAGPYRFYSPKLVQRFAGCLPSIPILRARDSRTGVYTRA